MGDTIDEYCYIALTTKNSSLCFGALGLTDADVSELCAAVGKNPGIETLQLFSNGITQEGAYSIAALILLHPNLKKIDLSGNQINLAGQEAIKQAITKSQRTIEIDFNDNSFPTNSKVRLTS